jgi:signal peptidase II
MAEPANKETNTRPDKGRVFLSRLNLKPTPDLTAHLIFWFVFIAGVALDLWSKRAVFKYLQDRHTDCIPLISGVLQIVTASNDGAAFGIASGRLHLLITVSVIALLVVLLVFLFGREKSRPFYLALGFLAAGISGNLYDRIFNNGHVRDFIDLYCRNHHWPAFNAADSFLCIAVGLILLLSFTERLYRKHHQQ